ncbi:FGGY-family carbohydrate kinase [Williamsia sp. CHRR-6]|uniref:FGGY-family carbohydrate kinase n=1 Tax=Williamsia sp. CHRR-6 TaxID=2835871 RepID=UPI001BDA6719|nr:FGGY-family carbohydrate kinase [Williamsia sp. CHRR-6]MBT0566528.1 hypothetical protein [Williamsia sp. CHRR-6]
MPADSAVGRSRWCTSSAADRLLCQLTADATRVPVIAGPVEASAVGNVVTQARRAGAIPDDVAAARALIGH